MGGADWRCGETRVDGAGVGSSSVRRFVRHGFDFGEYIHSFIIAMLNERGM